nr:hypothetical protein CFP56_37105 [Quercus suber]
MRSSCHLPCTRVLQRTSSATVPCSDKLLHSIEHKQTRAHPCVPGQQVRARQREQHHQPAFDRHFRLARPEILFYVIIAKATCTSISLAISQPSIQTTSPAS